jgi:hypothetical protein
MHMKDASKLVLIVLVLSLTLTTGAQELEGNKPPYRLKYENSPDLPNGIAFYMTLVWLDVLNTRLGPARPAEVVVQELKLDDVGAHDFVSQALTTLYFIKTDVKAQLSNHACQFVGPGVDKKQQYAALQQTYGIETEISDHYYEQTIEKLDPDTARRLQQWMDKEKPNTNHFEIDFEEYDQRTGNDSTATLSMLCGEAR